MSANLTNGQYVNITSGEVRITAFAQKASGEVKIFTLPFSTPTGGISVSVDTILGRNREINDIFNKAGNFSSTTSGKEVLVAKDGSMTLKDDFVYLSSGNAASIENTKSLMRSLAMGDLFTNDSTPYKVVGTNGTIKSGLTATGEKSFGLLTLLDGRLVVPQAASIDSIGGTINTITVPNTRISAYNKSSICVMFEVLTTYDTTKSEGYRFVYTLNSNFKYQEADDANEVSFDQMMLCDVRYITNFFYQGFSIQEYATTIPAKEVKLAGVANPVKIFKSIIANNGITYATTPFQPTVTVAKLTIPAHYMDATNHTLTDYVISVGDICIGYYTIQSTTPDPANKYYVILKCTNADVAGSEIFTPIVNNTLNTVSLTTPFAASTTALTAGTDKAFSAVATGLGAFYPILDFSFDLEKFEQIKGLNYSV